MPRKPGTKSNAKKVGIENTLITSFMMPWEEKVYNRPCCIEGCDHKCSGRADGSTGFSPFEPCSTSNAGVVVDKAKYEADHPNPYVGWCCPHCTDRILAQGD